MVQQDACCTDWAGTGKGQGMSGNSKGGTPVQVLLANCGSAMFSFISSLVSWSHTGFDLVSCDAAKTSHYRCSKYTCFVCRGLEVVHRNVMLLEHFIVSLADCYVNQLVYERTINTSI